MRERLAWMVASACVLLAACATGGDPGNDGPVGAGDSGVTVEASSEASSGHDAAGSGGQDAAATQDTGTSSGDTGETGDDASQTEDAPSMDEAAVAQDSGTLQDTGTTTTGQDSGTTTGGECSDTAKYDLEAVAVIASGTFTLCLSGVCSAGQCCFEGLSPGNVCVAE